MRYLDWKRHPTCSREIVHQGLALPLALRHPNSFRGLRHPKGKRPATALLYRHQTGFKKNADGEIIRGELNIADLSEEDERVVSVEVVGLLYPFTFDQIASAIIEGGRELLAKAALTVQLKGDRDKIGEIAKPGNMFLLEDLVVSFEIGEKFDEFSCDD